MTAPQALGRLWRGHRALLIGFVLALAVTLFFAIRLAIFTVYWSQHRDEPIQSWMTIGYVANSYDVDRLELVTALGLEPEIRARLTLAQIADRTGRSLPEVVAILHATIDGERTGTGDAP